VRIIKIPDTQLSDFLLRLNETEQTVCALTSATDNGWHKILGWNPIDICTPDVDCAAEEVEEFIAREQAKGRQIIGYVSYDAGSSFQDVALSAESNTSVPTSLAASFENWIQFDGSSAIVYAGNNAFLDSVHTILDRPILRTKDQTYEQEFTPVQSRDWYHQTFTKIKQYIRAGDVYQINLTHRLKGTTKLRGRELFCRLSESNPADFQAYIEYGDSEILSFSPERFIRVNDRRIETSPIKGTRPRGSTEREDATFKADLENSPKDMAELNMITDLLRNDLGKVCEIGSVNVTVNRMLTDYPTLWHAHSTIQGSLTTQTSPLNALLSMMPGGSITGCPKKRAIEIISELEPERRGIYTGSIFTVTPEGLLDSSIAIRTITKTAGELSLSVGGGIINDSTEEDEYQESLDKAASFMNSVRQTTILSSDVLEQQFGETYVVVLKQDTHTRVICTKSKKNQILEFSIVKFEQQGIDAFPEIHRAIVDGQSIGKAFREQGIAFVRVENAIEKMPLPQLFNDLVKSDDPATVISVSVLVGPEQMKYANILETYSPDVAWPLYQGKLNINALDILTELSKSIYTKQN